MKRSVLAALLLGALPAASHAQGSVTLYGLVDVGFLYTNKTVNAAGQNAGRTFAVADSGLSPSLFGMTGTEDLGNGVKVQFKLESGINVANGGLNDSNGNFFGRQAWVALSGNVGEIKAGLQFSPFILALLDSDPRAFAEFGDVQVIYGDNVVLTGVFNSNAVTYTSPKFGGLEGSVMFAPGGEAGNFRAGLQYSASLKYDDGTLMVNAAIYEGNRGGATSTPVPTTVEFEGRTLGAAYRFGSLTAKATFVNYKVAGSFNSNVYGGGLDYLVLPQLYLDSGVWVTSDRNNTKNHSLLTAVSAEYFLSKRTTLYAQVGLAKNHGAMNAGLSVSYLNILNEVPGTTVGINIGMRHVF